MDMETIHLNTNSRFFHHSNDNHKPPKFNSRKASERFGSGEGDVVYTQGEGDLASYFAELGDEGNESEVVHLSGHTTTEITDSMTSSSSDDSDFEPIIKPEQYRRESKVRFSDDNDFKYIRPDSTRVFDDDSEFADSPDDSGIYSPDTATYEEVTFTQSYLGEEPIFANNNLQLDAAEKRKFMETSSESCKTDLNFFPRHYRSNNV